MTRARPPANEVLSRVVKARERSHRFWVERAGHLLLTTADAAELQLHQPHWVRLDTRPPDAGGGPMSPAATATTLLPTRVRPRSLDAMVAVRHLAPSRLARLYPDAGLAVA